ncbi:hypothetical protein PL373_16085 [Tenacibaculum maritimum]|nr:hypothetical protein [Tenacibaculum maritimum]MDB0602621.1 hypothetical protein [Tenacibaculum maritimum]MDB0611267.1 hypothetical protein [Tenacibaculum maritimum]
MIKDNLLITAALKVYSEKLRGLETQSPVTKYSLERILELREKKITLKDKEIVINL